MENTTRRYEFLMEIITIGYWSMDGLGFNRERYGDRCYSFVQDDLLSLKTIEDHPKFGRVHSLFVGPADDSVNNHLEKPTVSSTKLNQWSQDMNVSLAFTDQPPPPRIPPHLLNILLNRKLPENVSIARVSFVSHPRFQCDPLLLPEPNSVMLRHLYALSIQVIVCSRRCSLVYLSSP